MRSAGLPHSAIQGSKRVCRSPWLIAAYRGLHRLRVPRHPPHAFSRLTTKSAKQTNALIRSAIHFINPAATHGSRHARAGLDEDHPFPYDLLDPSLFKQRPRRCFRPGRESNCNPPSSPCQPAFQSRRYHRENGRVVIIPRPTAPAQEPPFRPPEPARTRPEPHPERPGSPSRFRPTTTSPEPACAAAIP